MQIPPQKNDPKVSFHKKLFFLRGAAQERRVGSRHRPHSKKNQNKILTDADQSSLPPLLTPSHLSLSLSLSRSLSFSLSASHTHPHTQMRAHTRAHAHLLDQNGISQSLCDADPTYTAQISILTSVPSYVGGKAHLR